MSQFDPQQYFSFLTNRVGRLLAQTIGPKLKEQGYDMPTSCIGLLADLWKKDGVTQKELGISLIKTKSSIAKMLSQLEEFELIVKKDDQSDKRNKLIFVTKKGKELQKVVFNRAEQLEADLLAEFSKQDITTAKKVLLKVYLNLSDPIEINKRLN